ncbi:MAG: hypothetical protein V1729_06735 [Candidatus Woesearchaeota archaeon]
MNGKPKTESRDYMRIKPIDNGVVIDHLHPGIGLFILGLLDYRGLTVTPGLNYTSDKSWLPEDQDFLRDKDTDLIVPRSSVSGGLEGEYDMERYKTVRRKDIIYMEGGTLTSDQQGAVSVVWPQSTIDKIVDGVVVEKLHPVPTPDELGDILLCSNKKCTTNTEGGSRRFRVINPPSEDDPFRVQCCYCEKEFYGPLVKFYTGQTLRDVTAGVGFLKSAK